MATTNIFPYKDKATYDYDQSWGAQSGTTTITYGNVSNPNTGSNPDDAFIAFNLSQIPSGVINSIRLQIFFQDSAGAGQFLIYGATGAWSEDESGTNPTRDFNQVVTTSKANGAGWVDVDVTSMVNYMRSNGRDTFFLPYSNFQGGGTGFGRFESRTGSNPPRLLIDYTPPNVAPNAPTLTGPAANVNTRTPTVTWTYSDPDGNPQGSYRIEIVNSSYTAVIWGSGWLTGTATSYTIPAGVITADGTYYARVQVQDSNGAVNQANGTGGGDASFGNKIFVSDITTPSISSVTPDQAYNVAVNGTVRMWAFGVTDGTSGVLRVEFPTWSDVNSQDDLVWHLGTKNGATNDWYCDIPIGSPAARGSVEGHYTVHVYATDNAGNQSVMQTGFTIDRTKPSDPNPTVVYGTTTATITWNAFSDPAPSSGRLTTDFYLGQWNGTSYTNVLFNGTDVGNVTSKTVTGLVQGARYRYTVTYHDMAGNESFFTYKEFVTKKQIGTYRLKTAAGIISLPVYDPASGVLGTKAIRLKTANGVGCFELVDVTDPNASPIRVRTSIGTKALSK